MDNIDRLLQVINSTKYPQLTLQWMVYLLGCHADVVECGDRKPERN